MISNLSTSGAVAFLICLCIHSSRADDRQKELTAAAENENSPRKTHSNLQRRAIEPSDDVKAAAKSSNRFAFDLYRQLNHTSDDLFFSPCGISAALALVHAGAAGETRREIGSIISLNSVGNASEGYATVINLLNTNGDGYTLSTANRLWIGGDFAFNPDFVRLAKEKFSAPPETIFLVNPDAARRKINSWVNDRTRGKIDELLPFGFVTLETKLILTNAVYFSGKWDSDFPETTLPSTFFPEPNKSFDVHMMKQRIGAPCLNDDNDVQVVTLPYQGSALSMVIVLPRQKNGLSKVEESLTIDKFELWLVRSTSNEPIELSLPRFHLKSHFNLTSELNSLGLRTAFTDQADFSKMIKEGSLKISNLIHKAVIDVDEHGTEASAATGTSFTPASSFGVRKAPIRFEANHPFIFVIRDERTKMIIFMGRVTHPEAAEKTTGH